MAALKQTNPEAASALEESARLRIPADHDDAYVPGLGYGVGRRYC